MNGLHHRDPGTVGAAFTLPDVACELIADGIHVHPAVMRVLLDVKGVHGVILVSDAIRAAGMPEGDYPINDQVVHVKDGSVRFADGTLAGSILTLDVALRNVLHATQRPLSALWPVSSLNAARAIGLSSRTGSLEVGKDADLVVLDAHGDVCLTVARGQVVYERS
jgi:N-acetylglucosamine-6-phosphate deacetylase